MAIESSELKRIVGVAAAGMPTSGMTVGLGTGSTARAMVTALAQRVRDGEVSDLTFVSTSEETAEQARREGLVVVSLEDAGRIDMTIDGADEIDPQLRLIKGLGGALLREKIVAQASDRMIVIADFSKRVEKLGRGVLPVEIVRFGFDRIREKLAERGYETTVRADDGGTDRFITDEGHYILDLDVSEGVDVEALDKELTSIAGVVETGFFGTEASEALIGEEDGSVSRVSPQDH